VVLIQGQETNVLQVHQPQLDFIQRQVVIARVQAAPDHGRAGRRPAMIISPKMQEHGKTPHFAGQFHKLNL
jgi:hypothetical protein